MTDSAEPATRGRADSALKRASARSATPDVRTTTGSLLDVMIQLAGYDRVGVTRLARDVGIPTATAYRMLRALETAGLAEQLSESKEYRLTLKLFELGCQVASRTTLRDLAVVEIERLAQQVGMVANLGVLVGSDVLYLCKAETDELLTLNLPPGSRVPATCTAMGKAMLAFDTRPLRTLIGAEPYESRTAFSLTTFDEVSSALADVQRLGYAIDRQELALGLWCVAAPITGTRDGQQGAVSVAVCRPEMDAAEMSRLGNMVVGYATRISRRIGDLGDMRFR